MPAPIFFLIVIVAIAAIGIGVSLTQMMNEAWEKAGKELKLTFQPGRMFSSPVLSGRFKGFPVLINTYTRKRGNHRITYTRYRLNYPNTLDLGLKLTRQGLFHGIGKFFGAEDIEVGDKGFDDSVIVKGHDPKKVIEFLTPSRRLKIARFLSTHKEATIEDTKIEWSRQHVERNEDKIVRMVKRMASLAAHLSEQPTEDETVDKALEARQEGRLSDALNLVRGVPAKEDPDVQELHIFEGEVLLASGNKQEAAIILEEVAQEVPEDDETSALAALAANPSVPTPEASQTDSNLDVAEVCNALFDPNMMSSETTELFEKKFHGSRVQWTGTVTSVRSYTFDLVFGNDPGIRAVVEIHEVGESFGKRAVQAVIQFPINMENDLELLVDKELTFEGKLISCDAFMRNLFVAEGKIC